MTKHHWKKTNDITGCKRDQVNYIFTFHRLLMIRQLPQVSRPVSQNCINSEDEMFFNFAASKQNYI